MFYTMNSRFGYNTNLIFKHQLSQFNKFKLTINNLNCVIYQYSIYKSNDISWLKFGSAAAIRSCTSLLYKNYFLFAIQITNYVYIYTVYTMN